MPEPAACGEDPKKRQYCDVTSRERQLQVEFTVQGQVWVDAAALAGATGLPAPTIVTLNRDGSEEVGKTLTRAQKTSEKALQRARQPPGKGKGKKGNSSELPAISVQILNSSGVAVDHHLPSASVFVDGATLLLSVGKNVHCWMIRRDRPAVSFLAVPEISLVGFPTICKVDTVHADRCEFLWDAPSNSELSNAIECTPTSECRGLPLTVTVTPWRGQAQGDAVSMTCTHPVLEVVPEMLKPLDDRVTQFSRADRASAGASLRVVSYNVQWGIGSPKDKLASHVYSKGHSFSEQVDPDACSPPDGFLRSVADLPVPLETRHYRQYTLLREILGWDADVTCLQELTPPMHDTFLSPLLRSRGYGTSRSGELGVCWQTKSLQLQGEASWVVGELLDDPCNRDIRAAFEAAAPHSQTYFRGLPHLGQVAKFRRVGGGKDLVVVNVHLVMEKFAEQFRAVQLALIMRRVQRWSLYNSGGTPDVVVCGDFNTRGPDEEFTSHVEATLLLLRFGVVEANHPSFVLGRHVGRPKPQGHRHTMPGALDGSPTTSQCHVKLGGDAWAPQCPNAGTEAGGTVCWDHACRSCSKVKDDFRQARCNSCEREDAPLPPLPAEVEKGMFRCRLDLQGVDLPVPSFIESPICSKADYRNAVRAGALGGKVVQKGLTLDSARRVLPRSHSGFSPGAEHKYSFFTVDFHPPSGNKRPHAWVELRDHIFFSTCNLAPVHCAAPPPIPSFAGQLPGLTWTSDHLAVAADFRNVREAPEE
eukprot:m.463393 g.463393  ORF g.463393 m.463393 type:complete len:760 (-) comp23017_c0_seq1:70-2349(-)